MIFTAFLYPCLSVTHTIYTPLASDSVPTMLLPRVSFPVMRQRPISSNMCTSHTSCSLVITMCVFYALMPNSTACSVRMDVGSPKLPFISSPIRLARYFSSAV